MISQTVIERLLDSDDEVSDVTVHIDPEDDELAAPCEGLPLLDDAERMVMAAWENIAGIGLRERLLFHYLDGRIDVDVYFPRSVYSDYEEIERLQTGLQEALKPLSQFGKVTIYHG